MEQKIEHLKVNLIDVGDYQVRADDNADALHDLIRSIRRLGLLQPIIVESKGDRYLVVAGHRRLEAIRELGHKTIAAIVRDHEEKINWSVTMAENMVRRDLSPIETAAAVKDALASGEYDHESLASAVNRSQQWISQCITMCEWPSNIQLAVHTGKISASAAANIARIMDPEQRDLLLEYAVDQGATARTTAAWLQAYRAGLSTARPEQIEPVESGTGPQAIQPYTPCVVCDRQMKMQELRYLPICPVCQDNLIDIMRRGGNGGAVDHAPHR